MEKSIGIALPFLFNITEIAIFATQIPCKMLSTILEFSGHRLYLVAVGDALAECRWLDKTPTSDSCNNPTAREHEIIDNASAQLSEYFAGIRNSFSIPLAPRGTEFRMKVWHELMKIPYGSTLSYGELARRIGNPTSCRAVANACGANPIAVFIPCHRVVAAGGKTGGYNGGTDVKLALIDLEQAGCMI